MGTMHVHTVVKLYVQVMKLKNFKYTLGIRKKKFIRYI